MPETQVQSLGQEDPPEKGMAAHSSILVWRISWTEKPGRLQPVGSQTVTTERLTHTHTRKEENRSDASGPQPLLSGPGATGARRGAFSRAPASRRGGRPGECHSRWAWARPAGQCAMNKSSLEGVIRGQSSWDDSVRRAREPLWPTGPQRPAPQALHRHVASSTLLLTEHWQVVGVSTKMSGPCQNGLFYLQTNWWTE